MQQCLAGRVDRRDEHPSEGGRGDVEPAEQRVRKRPGRSRLDRVGAEARRDIRRGRRLRVGFVTSADRDRDRDVGRGIGRDDDRDGHRDGPARRHRLRLRRKLDGPVGVAGESVERQCQVDGRAAGDLQGGRHALGLGPEAGDVADLGRQRDVDGQVGGLDGGRERVTGQADAVGPRGRDAEEPWRCHRERWGRRQAGHRVGREAELGLPVGKAEERHVTLGFDRDGPVGDQWREREPVVLSAGSAPGPIDREARGHGAGRQHRVVRLEVGVGREGVGAFDVQPVVALARGDRPQPDLVVARLQARVIPQIVAEGRVVEPADERLTLPQLHPDRAIVRHVHSEEHVLSRREREAVDVDIRRVRDPAGLVASDEERLGARDVVVRLAFGIEVRTALGRERELVVAVASADPDEMIAGQQVQVLEARARAVGRGASDSQGTSVHADPLDRLEPDPVRVDRPELRGPIHRHAIEIVVRGLERPVHHQPRVPDRRGIGPVVRLDLPVLGRQAPIQDRELIAGLEVDGSGDLEDVRAFGQDEVRQGEAAVAVTALDRRPRRPEQADVEGARAASRELDAELALRHRGVDREAPVVPVVRGCEPPEGRQRRRVDRDRAVAAVVGLGVGDRVGDLDGPDDVRLRGRGRSGHLDEVVAGRDADVVHHELVPFASDTLGERHRLAVRRLELEGERRVQGRARLEPVGAGRGGLVQRPAEDVAAVAHVPADVEQPLDRTGAGGVVVRLDVRRGREVDVPLDREAVREVVRQRDAADRVGARDAQEVAVGRELDVGQDAWLPGLDVGVRAGRVAGGRDREDAVIGGEADDMDARRRVRDAVDREGPGREAILGPDIPEPEVLVGLLDERALEADVPRGQRRLFGGLVGLGLGLAVGERVSGGILREGRHPRDSRGQEDSESDPDEPTPPSWQRHRSPTPDDILTPSAAMIVVGSTAPQGWGAFRPRVA